LNVNESCIYVSFKLYIFSDFYECWFCWSIVTMDPFKGQGGIQMLLTAEQEAQHIVSNARNCKIECFLFMYLCRTNYEALTQTHS